MGVKKEVADFDPTNWEVIWDEDLFPPEDFPDRSWLGLSMDDRRRVNRGKEDWDGSCRHCGQTRLRFISFAWNSVTDEVMVLGQVCAIRAELPGVNELLQHEARKAEQAAKEREAIRQARDGWDAANAELAAFLVAYADIHGEGDFDHGPCLGCEHDGSDHRQVFDLFTEDGGQRTLSWCEGAGVDGGKVAIRSKRGDLEAGPGKAVCLCRKALVEPNGDAFVADMVRTRRLYGALTERQTEVLAKKPDQIAQRIERFLSFAAKLKEREATLADVPGLTEGRQDLTGVIQSVKEQESDYGWTLKMVVELEDGNRVWGTVPAAVEELANGLVPQDTDHQDWDDARRQVLVGGQITFTATVVPSNDDIHFGFTKRPSFTKKSVFIPKAAELEGAN